MGLSDFERELAGSKGKGPKHRHDADERRKERSHKHHHHRSSHKRHSEEDDEDRERRHRHKRRKHGDEDNEDRRKRREERRARRAEEDKTALSHDLEDSEDATVAEPGATGPREDEELDERLAEDEAQDAKRDDWMQAPSTLDVDYVQRRQKQSPPPAHNKSTKADYELKIHQNELNHQLRDIDQDESPAEEHSQHLVSYEFGDSGSQWRMTKLKAVYRQAEESGKSIEDLAVERFGSVREFDDAREEEIELDRRKTYGKDYVGKIKPSGELYEERKLAEGVHTHHKPSHKEHIRQGEIMPEQHSTTRTIPLDKTALNRLKAQMMKAKLRGGSEAARLEAEYTAALADAANHADSGVVVLNAMDSRHLSNREGEVTRLTNKRGVERGLVEENEDMSIEDMVRQERRSKYTSSGLVAAERIAKDAKFENDEDYQFDNAEKLSKRVAKSDINLRNMAIGDFQKMQKVLENCPLCHHEDRNPPVPPIAPIISLATRVYLTLPTEPEVSKGGAVIVPIQHHDNLISCDDDEWEEIRNFMKCLIRYYDSRDRAVVFYENAAHQSRKGHAAMVAIPLSREMGELAPQFFKEAIVSADEEWSQHKKVIDTLGRSRSGMGKLAFRRSIAKEMPYFHVWFELDGGMGHVVEDERRWPKGDLFAREIVGGMLDVPADVVKRQGRWQKGDRRVEGFRKGWKQFDWTSVLADG